MYKTATRALLRHAIRRLNAGDPRLVLRLASPDAELAFPGDNSWAAMFRPAVRGRQRHVTHRGMRSAGGSPSASWARASSSTWRTSS